MAEIEVEREAMAAKRGQIMVYLLRTQSLVRSFDEALLYGMVEQVRIGESGTMKFIFKDGSEIKG